MRLILSYPSRASALHTYHYPAMIYCVWSRPVTLEFLHVITARYHYISTSHYTRHQARMAGWLAGWTQCLDNNWHSLVNCESRWSVVTCTRVMSATSYLNIQLPGYSDCHPAAQIIHCGPGGVQTPPNENLHISPF